MNTGIMAEGELVRERDEAWAFLRRTAMTGGSIVSSAAMTEQQIAIARAADRMLVMPDGYGFVYVPGPRFCACGRLESDCDADLLPTLRDRFAMAALHGLLAADAGPRGYSRQSYRDDDPEHTARDAYRLADAMLAARAAKPEPGK